MAIDERRGAAGKASNSVNRFDVTVYHRVVCVRMRASDQPYERKAEEDSIRVYGRRSNVNACNGAAPDPAHAAFDARASAPATSALQGTAATAAR